MAQAQPAFPDLFPPQVDTTFRILSIDDDPIDRMRIRTLCRKAGVGDDIDEAHNIAEMRALLDEGGYDIVFIDYHLGLETGREALDVLLQHEDQANAIPIMVTSVTDHQVAIDAMRAGCSDYLVKEEMSVETLRKSIVSSLERRILLSAVSEMRMGQTHETHGGTVLLHLRAGNARGPGRDAAPDRRTEGGDRPDRTGRHPHRRLRRVFGPAGIPR